MEEASSSSDLLRCFLRIVALDISGASNIGDPGSELLLLDEAESEAASSSVSASPL